MHIEHEPGRFVARIDGREAELVYERRDDVLDVQHTYTPPELRGGAIAAQLTAAVFDYAQEHGLTILPTCSYTRAYVERHPELRALVYSSSRSVR
jgi:predicted GNAT family acetyltransferase